MAKKESEKQEAGAAAAIRGRAGLGWAGLEKRESRRFAAKQPLPPLLLCRPHPSGVGKAAGPLSPPGSRGAGYAAPDWTSGMQVPGREEAVAAGARDADADAGLAPRSPKRTGEAWQQRPAPPYKLTRIIQSAGWGRNNLPRWLGGGASPTSNFSSSGNSPLPPLSG